MPRRAFGATASDCIACRQKDPLVKSDRHPLERVGRLTDYSVVPHPARDCDSRDAGASTPACVSRLSQRPAWGGARAAVIPRVALAREVMPGAPHAPADVIQSQLCCSMCCDAVFAPYCCRWLPRLRVRCCLRSTLPLRCSTQLLRSLRLLACLLAARCRCVAGVHPRLRSLRCLRWGSGETILCLPTPLLPGRR